MEWGEGARRDGEARDREREKFSVLSCDIRVGCLTLMAKVYIEHWEDLRVSEANDGDRRDSNGTTETATASDRHGKSEGERMIIPSEWVLVKPISFSFFLYPSLFVSFFHFLAHITFSTFYFDSETRLSLFHLTFVCLPIVSVLLSPKNEWKSIPSCITFFYHSSIYCFRFSVST